MDAISSPLSFEVVAARAPSASRLSRHERGLADGTTRPRRRSECLFRADPQVAGGRRCHVGQNADNAPMGLDGLYRGARGKEMRA